MLHNGIACSPPGLVCRHSSGAPGEFKAREARRTRKLETTRANGSKIAPDGSKVAQDGPKIGPKMDPEGSRWLKMAPR